VTAARVAAGVAAVAAVGVLAWRPWQDVRARPVPWRDLTQRVGPLELARPANQAFATEADLRRFLRVQVPARLPRLPPIDFGRERAVIVSPGPRSSTGYGVAVVAVTRRGARTEVTLRETAPSLGAAVEPRVTHPYRLLAIATTGDEISFRWLGRP
jgi:hypothetical protein